MTPAPTKIFVKQDEQEKSKGGVIIAPTVKNTHRTGTITAVGRDVEEVSVGQRIMFDRQTSHPSLPGTLIVDIENVVGTIQ